MAIAGDVPTMIAIEVQGDSGDENEPMDIEQVETMYGTFHGWKDDLITTQLKTFSAHTRNEIAMLRAFLSPGDCVVDIGAHIGTYAIPFARFTAPGGRVFAFEANPENHALLVHNVAVNALGDSIVTTHAVVSDTDAEFEMRLQAGSNSGMYYFVPTAVNRHQLPCVHIDSWLSSLPDPARVALIKIDVEGAELAVLRSCLRTIGKELPVLYVEISESGLDRFQSSAFDIETMLAKLGYHFFRNIGERNSSNDQFTIARMSSLSEGGPFYDLLAVHPGSRAYLVIRELPGGAQTPNVSR